MPNKYLVEFLAEWIRDEALRCKVLRKERTELKKWGLEQKQIDDLVSLDKKRILGRLQSELEADFEIDLGDVLKAIKATGGRGSGGGAAGAVYQEGQPHVRRIAPKRIQKGRATDVVVCGHGYDSAPEISFHAASGGGSVKGTLLKVECDADVWQRATVRVTLPTAGKWRVEAKVSGKTSSEPVALQVT